MSEERLWWKYGVVYQIYPRSFNDSNGDGIGDLPGITEKLDYLKKLGVDGIWLSPIYESPMLDFGYDISNYRAIDPDFGTMEDFEILLDEAHKKDIRIVMDMVVNHTSFKHPWFIESSSSRDNPRADWYVWHDGINGKPPNNWMAMFGGRAWEWCEARQQYYFHGFLKEQPDLNWWNPEVREGVFAEMRFWLDKGVDGFRLDVINFLRQDRQFRNNPLTLSKMVRPRPYDMQLHIYDRNQEENHEIMRALRKMTDSYPDRMMVGEVFDPYPSPSLSASYLGSGEDELHLAFEFSIMFDRKWHAKTFYNYISNYYSALPIGGWPTVVLNNHDQGRSRSRFGGGKKSLARAKAAAFFLLTVKGTPFIYYGEELGMENGKLTRQDVRDPVGVKYWPFDKGRDPQRTPMLWNQGRNAGFSGTRPWLPLNENWEKINLEVQENDPDSIYHIYQSLLALRKAKKALSRGECEFLNQGEKNYLAYKRIYENEGITVLINFGEKPCSHILSEDDWEILLSTTREPAALPGREIVLAPLEGIILEKNS